MIVLHGPTCWLQWTTDSTWEKCFVGFGFGTEEKKPVFFRCLKLRPAPVAPATWTREVRWAGQGDERWRDTPTFPRDSLFP